jgi:hypothetical protein
MNKYLLIYKRTEEDYIKKKRTEEEDKLGNNKEIRKNRQ